MNKLLYKLFKKQFLKIYASEQCKKPEFKDLEQSFVDSEGNQYYHYPDSVALPISRLSKLMEYMMWINKGISPEEHDKMLDVMDKAMVEGLRDGKNAAKIGFIIQEMRERRGKVIPPELLCNYIAVVNVREDEDPTVFNNVIHLQKVEAIKNEIEKGNGYFFFQSPELKRLLNSLNTTEEELLLLLKNSKIKAEAVNQLLDSLQ